MVNKQRIEKILQDAEKSAYQVRSDKYNAQEHISNMERLLNGAIISIIDNHDQYFVVYPYLDRIADIERIGYIFHPEQKKLEQAKIYFQDGDNSLGEIALKLAKIHGSRAQPPIDIYLDIIKVKGDRLPRILLM